MKNFIKEINYYQNKEIADIYKPTSFWNKLIQKNFDAIKKGKIRYFRNKSSGFVGFVPFHSEIRRAKLKKRELTKILSLISSYKTKEKQKRKMSNMILDTLNGYERAKNSYKILLTDTKKPLFYNFNESKVGNPTEQFNFDGKLFSASSLNYLTGLLFLKKYIPHFDNKIFLEIGGGFGTVGEILNNLKTKNFKYINLDLPPLNMISEFYLKKSCNKKVSTHFDFRKEKHINISKLNNFCCLPNFDIERLKGKIDIFVNFISFQEMEYNVVNNYLEKIFKLKPNYILLRNLREGKNTNINTNKYKHKFLFFVNKPLKKSNYISILKKNYKMLGSNVEPYGFKTWDNYNSEILLFKRK